MDGLDRQRRDPVEAGRNTSMCSAKSSLLIKLDELEMSHTQSTPRSLWTVSDEYPRRGNSCISIC